MERLSKTILLEDVCQTSNHYNILPNLYTFLDREHHFTQIAQKAWDWLDHEPLHTLMVSPLSHIYYFEFIGATYGGECYKLSARKSSGFAPWMDRKNKYKKKKTNVLFF